MSSPPSPKGQNSSGKGEGRKVSSSDLSEVEHVETVSPEKPEPPALRQPDLALPPFPIVPRQSPGKSGSRPRPLVQFGENAYPPRWFVVQALPQAKGEGRNGEDASEKKGLAQLKWKFDPGPKDRWQGYTKSQLVTYAWNELEEALGNPKMKDKLAGAIRAGVLGYLVENTEDPMPPVPPAPARHEFVAEQLAVIKWASPTPNPSMRDFERPSLAARPGSNLQKLRTMGESAPGSQYSGGLVPKLGDTQSPNDINKEAALAKTSVLRQEVLADDGQPQPAVLALNVTITGQSPNGHDGDGNISPSESSDGETEKKIEEQKNEDRHKRLLKIFGAMAIKNLKNAGMPVPPQAAGIASQQGSPKKPQKPLHTGRKSKPGNAVQSSTTQPPTAQLPTFGSLKSMLEDPEFKKLSKARRGEEIASLRVKKMRDKYFPALDTPKFRRIRIWAGHTLGKFKLDSEDLKKLPGYPTTKRPFRQFSRPKAHLSGAASDNSDDEDYQSEPDPDEEGEEEEEDGEEEDPLSAAPRPAKRKRKAAKQAARKKRSRPVTRSQSSKRAWAE